MQPLDKTLRNHLERTVRDARDIAEDAARAALSTKGTEQPKQPAAGVSHEGGKATKGRANSPRQTVFFSTDDRAD